MPPITITHTFCASRDGSVNYNSLRTVPINSTSRLITILEKQVLVTPKIEREVIKSTKKASILAEIINVTVIFIHFKIIVSIWIPRAP